MKRKKINIRLVSLRILLVSIFATITAPFGLFAVPVQAAPCELYQSNAVNQVIVPWYKYLEGKTVDGKCRPDFDAVNATSGSPETPVSKTISLIVIAIIELLTRLAGLITVGFLIYGAFQYILSQGEPDGLKNAKSTIMNALVGFVIVLLATAIVQFMGRTIQ